MMKVEPHKEDPNVNMMLRSRATTREDKGRQPEGDVWVHQAPTKHPEYDL